jgi:hypothetical protein
MRVNGGDNRAGCPIGWRLSEAFDWRALWRICVSP